MTVATLANFPVNLTNSQRKALNKSATMRHFRTGLASGDVLEGVWAETQSLTRVDVQTDKNVFTWVLTTRGRIVGERVMKRG